MMRRRSGARALRPPRSPTKLHRRIQQLRSPQRRAQLDSNQLQERNSTNLLDDRFILVLMLRIRQDVKWFAAPQDIA